jgi:anti-sigma B factor antagonist
MESHASLHDSAVSIRRFDDGRGTVIISVAGELDLATAPTLKWALRDELQAGAVHLVLDLSETGFMDSTAIGVLVGIQRTLDAGRRVSLVALQPDVQTTFRLTGLDAAFRIFDAVDDALADFAPPADQAQSG